MNSNEPKITICVQCHNFEHRLCWMLSSLIGQDVAINVAYLHNNKRMLALLVEYRDKLPLLNALACHNYDIFQYRGETRNLQIPYITTPWVLWADTDMVYHPEYFARLNDYLDPSYHGMLIAGRLSQPNETIRITNRLVEQWQPYPRAILRPFDQARTLQMVRRANVGAGYFQLVQTVDCDGYYVPTASNRDHGWTDTYSKCRSDQQFRRRIGAKKKLPTWFSENQIHLNHARDNEAGRHLECQR